MFKAVNWLTDFMAVNWLKDFMAINSRLRGIKFVRFDNELFKRLHSGELRDLIRDFMTMNC